LPGSNACCFIVYVFFQLKKLDQENDADADAPILNKEDLRDIRLVTKINKFHVILLKE
jgi:hypothetical protein